MRDDRELMKLEGAEAINQLQDLADLVKYAAKPNHANKQHKSVEGQQKINPSPLVTT
jgi:hypothetical protein